jgi:hypothetical protein
MSILQAKEQVVKIEEMEESRDSMSDTLQVIPAESGLRLVVAEISKGEVTFYEQLIVGWWLNRREEQHVLLDPLFGGDLFPLDSISFEPDVSDRRFAIVDRGGNLYEPTIYGIRRYYGVSIEDWKNRVKCDLIQTSNENPRD